MSSLSISVVKKDYVEFKLLIVYIYIYFKCALDHVCVGFAKFLYKSFLEAYININTTDVYGTSSF